jgi:putative restriction endonuclease
MISTIDDAVEALYDLSVGVIGQGADRHERPHKPAMLLAVLDLIATGAATPDRVRWSQELRSRFSAYFDLVRSHNDQCTPENPFLYLRQDRFWEPLRVGQGGASPLESTPTAGDATGGMVFAKLVGGLERFVLSPSNRLALRLAIVSRYFPKLRAALLPLFADGGSVLAEETPSVKETADETHGRNPAFRRKILEIYDCKCAACGLRIKLPEVNDLTFVDAAHLIPFEVEANDNPTNGIALCKNHHWAMDRFLIAPCPAEGGTGVWRASRVLKGRRSRGEEELLALDGMPVLPPAEEAFNPDRRSLEWRYVRLVA